MKDLQELRTELDTIDTQLLSLLAQRFAVTHQVGEYKKINNLPARDLVREAEMYERLQSLALEKNLSPELIVKIYKLIIGEVAKKHESLRSNE